MTSIVVMPDAQVEKDSPIDHLVALGNYIADKKPTHIVCGGDFGDFPSLSNFNTALEAEGLRYIDDCDAAIKAMKAFLAPIQAEQLRLKVNKKKQYQPKMIFITGNHDCQVRVNRYIGNNPVMEGAIRSIDQDFAEMGWEIIPYLEVYEIEKIWISHWIANPHSLKGSPLSGQMTTMLKNAGHSFMMFHQQRYSMDRSYLGNGHVHLGIVAGAFYMHEMSYQNPQARHCWKGALHLTDVKDGNADIEELSISKLLKNWG